MHFLNILAALGVVGLAAANDEAICKAKFPKAYQAINFFCLNRQIEVPSSYARGGFSSSVAPKAKVWITNQNQRPVCRSKKWVPQQYCYSQFFQMCAQGKRKVLFGSAKPGCQVWHIQYAKKLPTLIRPKPKLPTLIRPKPTIDHHPIPKANPHPTVAPVKPPSDGFIGKDPNPRPTFKDPSDLDPGVGWGNFNPGDSDANHKGKMVNF